MKALVIAPEPFFSPRGTPFSVYYRALVMSELGVTIDLLTYGEGEDPSIPGVRVIRIPNFGFLGPVPVGPSMLKLFLDGFLVVWTIALLMRHRYDFVHAHEESVFFCRLLKRLFGFKLVYDMHSSLPQQLRNFGFTQSLLIIRMFERLENWCLATADAVVTISPALADYAAMKVSDPGRLFLIENSIFETVRLATRSERTGKQQESWADLIPSNRRVIGYAGTFEAYQGLDLLIEAFAKALEAQSDLFLVLIGGATEQVRKYRGLTRELGVEEDTLFCGSLPQSQSRTLMNRADVHTSPRTRGSNTPLKIYELLASGKPIVATRIPSHTQVLSDEVCFLADAEPESLAEAILESLEPEKSERVVDAARRLYEERYSRSSYEEKMLQLLGVLS